MSRSGEKEEGALLRVLRASDWAAAEALLSRWRKAEGGGGSRSAGDTAYLDAADFCWG